MKLQIDEENNTFFHIDWFELVSIYKQIHEGTYIPRRGELKNLAGLGSDRANWKKPEDFFSVNSDVMLQRLHNGYEFDTGINPEKLPTVTYDKPRPRYTDDPEGEFNYDLYNDGETEYFLTRPPRKSVGGLRLRCHFEFAAGIDEQVVGEYTQWLGHVIQHFQSRGFDLEIELYSNCSETYYVDKTDDFGYPEYSNNDMHVIRVSRFGERVMPNTWSALFSPGGYRHFMFLAYCWPGEIDASLNPTGGLGHTKQSQYDILWERDTRTIHITTNPRNNYFPLEDMSKKIESWRE